VIKEPLSHILNRVASLPKSKQVDELQRNATVGMVSLLTYAIDPQYDFLLPVGPTEYDKESGVRDGSRDDPGLLHAQIRTLYLYVKGGNLNLDQKRREQLWRQLLETVHPDDAVLLNLIKDKTLPKGLSALTVAKAFPQIRV
jgi:hypothetical protein